MPQSVMEPLVNFLKLMPRVLQSQLTDCCELVEDRWMWWRQRRGRAAGAQPFRPEAGPSARAGPLETEARRRMDYK